ncbi:MAG: hypothetical protein WC846_02475 [Candidatus Gracilibacteria bacterium]|jgi:predicted transcriptional regulator of viral defense system
MTGNIYDESQDLAGLSAKERQIVSYFSANEMVTVKVKDMILIHPCKRETANQILRRLNEKGWLQRLKRGIYATIPLSSSTSTPVVENGLVLAMDLFKPAFISGWSAAEHWGLTEQIFNSISVVTSSPQRKIDQTLGNCTFRIRTLSKNRFFGTQAVWFGSKSAEIADPSRTLIDILDLPGFGGGMRHTIDIVKKYWTSNFCNPDLLLQYAIRYNKGTVFKRLGFLAEKLNVEVPQEWIEKCQKNITKGVSTLDPSGSKKGEIISKWNLRINTPL